MQIFYKKRDLRRDLFPQWGPRCNSQSCSGESVDQNVGVIERLCCESREVLDQALRVLRIVRVTANLPQVGAHGLFATGGVALSEEVRLVGRDLHQVLAARTYGCCDFREARASCELIRLRLGRAFVLTYHVDAGTNRVGRRCFTVGSQKRVRMVAVRVTCLGAGAQKARYILDTFCPFNFCHSLLAITRATSGKALVVALRNALALSSDYPQSSLVNLSESPSKPDERE